MIQMSALSYRSRQAKNPIEEEDRVADMLARQGKKVIKLNRGDPAVYFKTPDYVIDAYKRALDSGKTHYTDPVGVPELRQAVADRYKRLYGLETNAGKVIVTQGVSEALLMLNFTLINRGDKGILFRPYYPIYIPYLRIFGGGTVMERYAEGNCWNVDTDSLERSLKKHAKSKRVKYMMITNPNNPTGTVLSRSTLEEVVNLANEYDLLLISDEIYDELVFNKAKFTSICQVAQGISYAILNGASKNFDATGFRLGFILMPGEHKNSEAIREALKRYATMRLSANAPGQYALAEAMNNEKEHKKAIGAMVKELESRVNFTTKRVNESRFMHAVVPKGAFYIFPRVDFSRLALRNDRTFVDELLREEQVQITRGSGFGDEGHVRIVSLAPKEILESAINRIDSFCRRHER